MPTVYTEVEVDVSMSDFSDEDLLDELEARGLGAEAVKDTSASELINFIYQKRRLGQDYQTELDQLIYSVVGRVI